ncbi:hypothetical protein NEOLEDRAFT_778646 [Neolentinus lepideus HHB14362 ss-1]|uniref:Uncharacterized protein n=1 Tax=Neolentinus lepideus HHB14362 ss-1 TaxID=1314782 RepID=A0A165UVU5_9AGAM|nr:hypothetical protein NEOLEDRAFT_778646 [Neolentinus lepideus HHB14362 ss-1]
MVLITDQQYLFPGDQPRRGRSQHTSLRDKYGCQKFYAHNETNLKCLAGVQTTPSSQHLPCTLPPTRSSANASIPPIFLILLVIYVLVIRVPIILVFIVRIVEVFVLIDRTSFHRRRYRIVNIILLFLSRIAFRKRVTYLFLRAAVSVLFGVGRHVT